MISVTGRCFSIITLNNDKLGEEEKGIESNEEDTIEKNNEKKSENENKKKKLSGNGCEKNEKESYQILKYLSDNKDNPKCFFFRIAFNWVRYNLNIFLKIPYLSILRRWK